MDGGGWILLGLPPKRFSQLLHDTSKFIDATKQIALKIDGNIACIAIKQRFQLQVYKI